MLMIAFLAFSQNGLTFMSQAANCQMGNTFCTPSRSSYLNSEQEIISMRLKATEMAKIFTQNTEMIKVASNSSDPIHRVAAAFACGMKRDTSELIFMLATDKEPIVSQASREAMIYMAKTKLNKPNVDFGPFPNSDTAQKDDAVKLWRIFFETNSNVEIRDSQKKSGTECVKYAKPCNTPVILPEVDSGYMLRLEAMRLRQK